MAPVIEVRRRLARSATAFRSHHGLSISMLGRLYLAALVTRAAIRVVREGRVDDVGLAEANLHTLLAEAGGAIGSAATAGPENVGPAGVA